MAQGAQGVVPEVEVAVFWDAENCVLPDGNISKFARNLKKALKKKYGGFKLSANTNNIICVERDFFFSQERNLLEAEGFTVHLYRKRDRRCMTCHHGMLDGPAQARARAAALPYERSMDVADSLLISHMLGLALMGSLPQHILLISGDRDFELAARYLGNSQFKMMFAGPHDRFIPGAYARWIWEKLVKGMSPE